MAGSALPPRMLAGIARSLEVDGYEQAFTESQPTNRLVGTGDIPGAAVWLRSDPARQVTGSLLTVDGGYTAR